LNIVIFSCPFPFRPEGHLAPRAQDLLLLRFFQRVSLILLLYAEFISPWERRRQRGSANVSTQILQFS
jgi:hypothetical protein